MNEPSSFIMSVAPVPLTPIMPHDDCEIVELPGNLPPILMDDDGGQNQDVSQKAKSDAHAKEANIDCGNDDDDESADALAKDDEGAAHFKQGNYDEALESYQEALVIKSRIQNAAPENKTNIVSIAYTLCNMAAVYEKQRRFDLAVEKLEKALTSKESNTSRISESSIAVTLSNLGDVHKKNRC